jgi:two-component system LytT family response regulator
MINTNLRAVIVEDESESLQLLSNLIVANGYAIVVGSTSDPQKAIDLIVSLKPDILFLDIKMPGKSGFEILDELKLLKSVNPYIIFTTAFNEFAIKAFEYAAFDYLLKPVEPKRLNDSILRCIGSQSTGNTQKKEILLDIYKKLMFRSSSGIVFIDPIDIIYIEAAGNYSVFHLKCNKTETVTVLLGKIEEMLSDGKFFRISRSFIINTCYLKKIDSKHLRCILSKNGTDISCEISRDRISVLVEKMKQVLKI